MLTFDPLTHTYYWKGVKTPGVSEILKKTGLAKDYSFVDPFYRDRGIAVHKAIELYLKGTLDEESLDPVVVPYFVAFKVFWKDHGIPLRTPPLL